MDWLGKREPVEGREGIFVTEISAADALSLAEYTDDTDATLELIRLAAVGEEGDRLFDSHDAIKSRMSLPAIKDVGQAALKINALEDTEAGND